MQLAAPEVLAPPDPPLTPAIDTSTAGTADSTSSGSAGDAQDFGALDTASAAQAMAGVRSGASGPRSENPYQAAAEEEAAALVDLGGVSTVTVDEYRESVPPNLAAASALLAELSASLNANSGLVSAAYVALSSDDALSLTVLSPV